MQLFVFLTFWGCFVALLILCFCCGFWFFFSCIFLLRRPALSFLCLLWLLSLSIMFCLWLLVLSVFLLYVCFNFWFFLLYVFCAFWVVFLYPSISVIFGSFFTLLAVNPCLYYDIFARFEVKNVHFEVELYFCVFRTSFLVGWTRTSCTATPRSWSPTSGMCTPRAACQPAQRNRNSCLKTCPSCDVIQCVKKTRH